MRELTSHVVEGDLPQNQLVIRATDLPGAGGASHRYIITGYDNESNEASMLGDPTRTVILFQKGGITEKGLNGITQEALLAIVADRLQGFQKGPYPSEEGAAALLCIEAALNHLKARTAARLARGVEGKTVA